ncbi:MAG TPA: ABC transporter permease [Gemmatimonadaceae bacterium]|jgi:ABC-2 type transport system permease protein|nr:ABC transporter permease [Gemmatimonadaceae bacterium]
MGSVYRLTLHQLSGKWRLTIMTVLASMPVIIAVLMLRSDNAPSVREFETAILSAMLAGSIAPLVVLAIAAAAMGNEVEDRTLANLTLAPIPRWQIAVPKLLAVITIAAPFMAVSAFLTSWVAYIGDVQATIAVTTSAVVGVALYAAAFVWLGLVSSQAIGLGLLYIVLWEGFFSGFVSGVRLLSIRHYAIALMHGLDDRRFAFGSHLSLAVAVLMAVLVFGGFLFFSIRRLRRMDVP